MIRLAFYIRDSQEIDLRSHPGLWWKLIRSHVSPKAKKVSTLRGPAQMADLQGTLNAPTQYSYKQFNKQQPASSTICVNNDAFTLSDYVS